MEFVTCLLASVDHFQTLLFAYCNVANNLFLFTFVALNSYHDPAPFSGTVLLQLCKSAMEMKPTTASSLGKQPLFSTSSHCKWFVCRETHLEAADVINLYDFLIHTISPLPLVRDG